MDEIQKLLINSFN